MIFRSYNSKSTNVLSTVYFSSLNNNNVLKIGEELSKCYQALGLEENCSKEELKDRYLALVRTYHPDTGGESADAKKFSNIRDSYKFILDNDYSDTDREELENVPKIFDIRHTAPQHRQYLEFEGIGSGTPAQRQRQYQQYRVSRASDNVQSFMMEKALASDRVSSLVTKTKQEAEYARRWKTGNAMERLVEDLIKESMEKGEFDNLPGFGKPLRQLDTNPYLDGMTQKINRLLVQQGFSPDWIMLEKEIRQEIVDIRQLLRKNRAKVPLNLNDISRNEAQFWKKAVAQLEADCEELNKKINHFNLVVPIMSRQMVHLEARRELDRTEKALKSEKELLVDKQEREKNSQISADRNQTEPSSLSDGGILKSFLSALRKKHLI